jgi:hypothetical protein
MLFYALHLPRFIWVLCLVMGLVQFILIASVSLLSINGPWEVIHYKYKKWGLDNDLWVHLDLGRIHINRTIRLTVVQRVNGPDSYNRDTFQRIHLGVSENHTKFHSGHFFKITYPSTGDWGVFSLHVFHLGYILAASLMLLAAVHLLPGVRQCWVDWFKKRKRPVPPAFEVIRTPQVEQHT